MKNDYNIENHGDLTILRKVIDWEKVSAKECIIKNTFIDLAETLYYAMSDLRDIVQITECEYMGSTDITEDCECNYCKFERLDAIYKDITKKLISK